MCGVGPSPQDIHQVNQMSGMQPYALAIEQIIDFFFLRVSYDVDITRTSRLIVAKGITSTAYLRCSSSNSDNEHSKQFPSRLEPSNLYHGTN